MCKIHATAERGVVYFSEIFTGKEMILCRDIAKKH